LPKDADPDLAAALDVARDGTTRGLDLARGDPTTPGRAQPELAETDAVAGLSQPAVAALLLLAVLGALRLKHVPCLPFS
jgi:hypothetical protein